MTYGALIQSFHLIGTDMAARSAQLSEVIHLQLPLVEMTQATLYMANQQLEHLDKENEQLKSIRCSDWAGRQMLRAERDLLQAQLEHT